ncbi:unnamed protein product, partial [Ectocarpus sp. 8 AP-2014]
RASETGIYRTTVRERRRDGTPPGPTSKARLLQVRRGCRKSLLRLSIKKPSTIRFQNHTVVIILGVGTTSLVVGQSSFNQASRTGAVPAASTQGS